MDIEAKKDFIYLLNKCSMLYIHLDKDTKKDVLNNIKEFILKLHETFNHNNDLKNLELNEKKEKILSTLIPYLDKLTTHFMIEHICIDENKKEFLIKEIDISSLSYARKLVKNDTHEADDILQKDEIKKDEIKKDEIKKSNFQEQINKVTYKITNHIDDKIVSLHEELNNFFKTKFDLLNEENRKILENSNENLTKNIHNLEDQINQKVENKFETHKNESSSYLTYVSQKIYQEIEKYSSSYLDSNYNKIRDQIRDKIMYELETQIKNEIHNKLDKLTHILNKNLENSLKNATQLTSSEIHEFMEQKIKEYEYLIQNTPYVLHFDKVSNTVKLMNGENTLSSITLPLIQGPKGERGIQGERGSTPIFKNIDVTKDGYISVIVQDEHKSYELKSANKINIPVVHVPQVPQQALVQGKEKDSVKEVVNVSHVTKVVHDLNFDKSHVMRLDSNNEHTLIILKSLSIGENSHCIRPNSLAIGGATTFQEHSLAIGSKSQTLSKNSIALFGSTSGENSFAYHAQNVPSNQFIVGQNNDNTYNVQKISLNAEHIQLNSKNISINSYDEKLRALESKIAFLEKQMIHKDATKIKDNSTSGFTSIFPSSFVQDKFFNN